MACVDDARGRDVDRCQHRTWPPPDIVGGPSEEGPPLLPDSLTARASFTSGFPLYPYPNLPMTLQPVVNRCANSAVRIDHLFTWSQWSSVKNPLHRKPLARGRSEIRNDLQPWLGWALARTVIDWITTGSSGTFWGPVSGVPLVGT